MGSRDHEDHRSHPAQGHPLRDRRSTFSVGSQDHRRKKEKPYTHIGDSEDNGDDIVLYVGIVWLLGEYPQLIQESFVKMKLGS